MGSHGAKKQKTGYMRDIFDKYYQTLLRKAMYFVHDEPAAQDIVQEVFIQVWKKGVDGFTDIGQYLKRSVRNRALNYLRDEKTRKGGLKNYNPEVSEEIAEAFDKTVSGRITELIQGLPDKRREIFLLVFKEELSYQEAAVMLGLSGSTVRVQYKRAVDHIVRNFSGSPTRATPSDRY